MADMPTHVPLNKLLLSPANCRKTNVDVGIRELADSMYAKGVLQNLVVSPRETNRGFFDVDAGGRRWRAAKLNVELKRWARDYPIPVLVIPPEQASEASLAENLRVPLNPADEVVAFLAVLESYARGGILDRGEQIERCAIRFGVEARYVVEQLRLASLAPDVLEALRLGTIGLDAAKAYAAYPDQDLQLRVFARQEANGGHGSGRHSVRAIRAELAGRVYRKGDRQVRYVTIETYIAAGGRIELELFMGNEDEEVLLDTALVDRLCRDKAEAEARLLAEEAGFADGLVWGWGPQSGWPKTPAGFEPVPQGAPKLSPKDRGKAVAIYRIADDGTGLVLDINCFRPKAAKTSVELPPIESETDRLARIRREKIEQRAIRLATPAFAGTAFEHRVFWPKDDTYWIEPVQRDEAGDYFVALLIRVPAGDVEGAMAQAERIFDEEEAAADSVRAEGGQVDEAAAVAA